MTKYTLLRTIQEIIDIAESQFTIMDGEELCFILSDHNEAGFIAIHTLFLCYLTRTLSPRVAALRVCDSLYGNAVEN